MRRPSFKTLAALTLLLAATGAAPATHSGYDAHAALGPPDAVQRVAVADSAVAIPDTPVGVRLSWTLDLLNGRAQELTAAEVSDRFAPDLLSLLPPEQVAAAVSAWATAGPFQFQGFARPPAPAQATALLTNAGGASFVLPVAVEPLSPHRITGMDMIPLAVPEGTTLEGIAADGPQTGYSGGLYEIGGRQMYLSCRGSGGPTVLLESGLGDGAAPWFAVESAVAGFTRVCSYDRPNVMAGASDPAAMPRTGADAVDDLHALLRTANVPGPYVLTGHSIGGHVARLYAARYPDEVAGMVLVDPSYEAGIAADGSVDTAVTDEDGAEVAESMGVATRDLSNLEGMDRDRTNAQVRAAAPPPDVPLVIITAGHGFDDAELPPGVSAEELTRVWIELQAGIAQLTPGGRQVVAEHSGHYVHQTEPELVVEAIRQVVAEAAR